jgi:hypothetical protein
LNWIWKVPSAFCPLTSGGEDPAQQDAAKAGEKVIARPISEDSSKLTARHGAGVQLDPTVDAIAEPGVTLLVYGPENCTLINPVSQLLAPAQDITSPQ